LLDVSGTESANPTGRLIQGYESAGSAERAMIRQQMMDKLTKEMGYSRLVAARAYSRLSEIYPDEFAGADVVPASSSSLLTLTGALPHHASAKASDPLIVAQPALRVKVDGTGVALGERLPCGWRITNLRVLLDAKPVLAVDATLPAIVAEPWLCFGAEDQRDFRLLVGANDLLKDLTPKTVHTIALHYGIMTIKGVRIECRESFEISILP
jgi:hypothetical protein